MDIKELKNKTEGELRKDLAALQEKIRELRFKNFSGEIKNVKEIPEIRKTIARIHTLLSQRANAK